MRCRSFFPHGEDGRRVLGRARGGGGGGRGLGAGAVAGWALAGLGAGDDRPQRGDMPVERQPSGVGEGHPDPSTVIGNRPLDSEVAGLLQGGECLDKAESERAPAGPGRKKNSAQSVEASSATMDSRVVGWISSSKHGFDHCFMSGAVRRDDGAPQP